MRHEQIQAATCRFVVREANDTSDAVLVSGCRFEDAAIAYLESAACTDPVDLVVCDEDTGLEQCFHLELDGDARTAA